MADLGKMEFTIRFIMIGDLIRNTVSISTMKESGKYLLGLLSGIYHNGRSGKRE